MNPENNYNSSTYSDANLSQARRFFSWLHDNDERGVVLRKLCLRLHQCGWIEEMKTRCKQIFQRSVNGIEDVTVEELVWGLQHSNDTRTIIPDSVKTEILEHIQLLWVRFRQEEEEQKQNPIKFVKNE